jgi:hypothetical protein
VSIGVESSGVVSSEVGRGGGLEALGGGWGRRWMHSYVV